MGGRSTRAGVMLKAVADAALFAFIAACVLFFVGDTVHAAAVGDAARAFRNVVMYAAGLITAFVVDVVEDD